MNRKVLQVVLCTLSFVVIASGGPTVRTEILGGVVKTGIGQYGTYQYLSPNTPHIVNVSCTTSVLSQDAEIIILENDAESGLQAKASIGSVDRTVFPFRITSTGTIQLTCRLRIATTLDQNRGSFVYVADDSVELNVWPVSGRPQCVSSIGSSGTEGETTTLTCITSVNSRETEIRWRGPMGLQQDIQLSNGPLLATIRTLNVSQVVNGLVCQRRENGQQWMEACTLLPLTVLRENSINIRPMLFSPDVGRLTITCETRPPDRNGWLVFGDYGDVVDGHFRNVVLPGSKLHVKITQKGGVSTLEMSGPSIPLHGIHTVICTTGERRYFRIAISQARGFDSPSSPTISTDVSSVTNTSTTTETVTLNNQLRTGSSVTSNVIIVILSLLVIVLGLVSTFLCIRIKSSISMSQSRPDIKTNGPIQDGKTEYEMYNPVYNVSRPYSELLSGGNTNQDSSSNCKHDYEIPKP